ncbi:hypothetical protein OsI_04535 [Oryza sativa Indica Group]|uniref:Uncharacterized protein n=2 Tax=Oryza TaxID=4527 RepID=A0A0E0FW29_ORYNI|nr:hypothetical protein OsI_04535 [Oryza sativa Indica Group]
MESGANARRRRRLVDRGSDRLAFITGQAQSLPSDPSPDSPLYTVDAASLQRSERQLNEVGIGDDIFNYITQLQKSESGVQPTSEAHLETHKEKHQGNESDLQKLKTSNVVPEIQPVNEKAFQRHSEETLRKKNSHDRSASTQPMREMETRPRYVPPNQSNQSDSAGWSVETLKEILNFAPHEITQAISATEYNRFLASVIIGFLVVLSNWGLDVGGTITKVLVATRPILFLIVTNITIVFTLLMENKDPNVRGRPAGSNLGSADNLGQMLEIGLLLQKALSTLLIDCSVCAVIMICFI